MNLLRHDKDAPPVVMHPPYAFVIAVATAWILTQVAPFDGPRIGQLVLPALGLGLLLGVWSSWVMHKADTGIPTYQTTTKIVDSGPFAIMRNPIYVGLILILLGLACLRGSGWYWLATIGFTLFLHFGVVLREEGYLTEKFGDAYGDYCSRVKRWGLF